MRINNSMANCHPQSCPSGFGRIEGFEQPQSLFLVEPRPLVGDTDLSKRRLVTLNGSAINENATAVRAHR